MGGFVIEQPFWELFPGAEIGVVLAKGIDNTEGGTKEVRPDVLDFLRAGNGEARKFLGSETFSDNPVVAVWREAYRRFKTKKGVRCSIENLLKRVEKGNEVGAINPLVDIYNAVSLRWGLPCGGEDLDTFQGDLRLTVTRGDDAFLALGDEENDDTLPGEVCYLDDAGAVCRCWNWRDGRRTMLTENTENAFLIIESVDPARSDDLKGALEMLAERTHRWLGGTTDIFVLNRDNYRIDL